MTGFVPARVPDGLYAYVVISTSLWDAAKGRDSRRIVWAPSLKDAKAEHGWTRERHTTIRVRRARHEDMPGGAS